MPRISAELRARMCSFTYSDGRRCRLPRAAAGEGYCHSHAAKITKQREDQFVSGLLTEPIAHSAFTSTSLTFMLARLFALVANGRVSPKHSNALLRIIDGLRKTLRNTTQEFLHCYDAQGLRTLVENLYNEHEEFLCLNDVESRDKAALAEEAGQCSPDTVSTSASTSAPPTDVNERPELIPAPPARPRPTPSPEELLKHLEQRLASH